LAGYVRRALDSEYVLKELVRDADVEWGRMFGERPVCEQEGRPADPDDPFTAESVREALSQLFETLTADRKKGSLSPSRAVRPVPARPCPAALARSRTVWPAGPGTVKVGHRSTAT
jgi:hypothetical protein